MSGVISEFTSYVFQILSQLLEARPAPVPKIYMELFEPLLTPGPYENRGNIPSLVCDDDDDDDDHRCDCYRLS